MSLSKQTKFDGMSQADLEKERNETILRLIHIDKAMEKFTSFTDRYSIYPIQNKTLYNLYKKQETNMWIASEYDFSQDKKDYYFMKANNMKREAKLIKFYIIATITVDGQVGTNINNRILLERYNSEERLVLQLMAYMEGVHAETYGMMGEAFFNSYKLRNKVKKMMELPFMKKRYDLLDEWMLSDRPAAERYAAIAAFEGISLRNLFLIPHFIAKLGKCPKIAELNEKISKDEGYHSLTDAEFSILVNSTEVVKVKSRKFIEIVESVVAIEDEIGEYLYSEPIRGQLDLEGTRMFTRILADQVLKNLGVKPIYNVVLPERYSWMLVMDLDRKTSFFDRLKDYSKTGEGDTIDDSVFDCESDDDDTSRFSD